MNLRPQQSVWRVVRPYFLTAMAVAISVPLRLALDPLLGDKMAFVTVFPIVVVSAWWVGAGPALFATALGSAVVAFFVLEPRHSFAIASPEYRVGIVINAVVCLACIAIFSSLRRARMLAEDEVQAGAQREQELQREIGERKAVEANLRESEGRFRGIFNQAAIGVGQTSLDRQILDVNPGLCRMLGYGREELVGRSVLDVTHPDEQQAAAERIRPLLAGEVECVTMERRFRHKYGHYISTHAISSLLRDHQGRPQSIVSIVEDITERKRAEDALHEADRRKDEFLATLAHELRNPLAPICNSLHILRLAGSDAPVHESVIEMMERQVSHMVRLVDDLMEVSRISRGKIELRKERVELAAIIRSAVETSRPTIDGAEHRLAISLPAEPITLEADPVRLSQVFANLLNNAAKYTDHGGQIWLAAEVLARGGSGAGEVIVRVRDTGMGIPAEMLPRVFDMFTQLDRPREQAQVGLGIGLTLVRNLVEMHGGRVQAQSDGPGQGSEFMVHLPLAVAPHQPAESPRSPRSSASEISLTARKLLIVDDNHDAAQSLALLLGRMGLQVDVAFDGFAALDFLTTVKPDAILLDIGMPEMNGYEVALRIRQRPELAGVLLIALTGWGQEDDRRRSREAGFDHHLVKPVDLVQLRNLLATRETSARY